MRNVLLVNTVTSFKPQHFPHANLPSNLSIKFHHGHKILTTRVSLGFKMISLFEDIIKLRKMYNARDESRSKTFRVADPQVQFEFHSSSAFFK